MSRDQQAQLAGLTISTHVSVRHAVESLWSDGKVKSGKLIAINAEKVLKVRNDPILKSILQRDSLLYADGVSVVWHLRKLGFPATKVAGCELWVALMEKAADLNTPTLIIGGTEQVNSGTVRKLGAEFGMKNVRRLNGYDHTEAAMLHLIDEFRPEIVTVALGSPKQEFLMQRLYEHYSSALYMGVGGSYDVYTGSLKRAPEWMIRANLEFAYRLYQQPTRILRQVRLVKFFWLGVAGKI